MKIENNELSAVCALTFHARQFVRINSSNGAKPKVIIDNDDEKIGQIFCDVPIVSPETALKKGINKFYLIGPYVNILEKQLLNLGVDKSELIYVPRSSIAITGKKLKKRNDITNSFLESISTVCKNNNFKLWLDSSGLLASARNQQLGSLSDVDLLIKSGNILTFYELLKKEREDWIIETNASTTRPVEKTQIAIYSSSLFNEDLEPAVIDIRGSAYNPHLLKKPRLLESHFIKNSKLLKNTILMYPRMHEIYLNEIYGDDWRIPDEFYLK